MMIQALSLKQLNSLTLVIAWSDGKHTHHDVRELRRACPCALCQKYPPNIHHLIARKVQPVDISSIGRYALRITFSDGHRSGIYTYESLRKSLMT
ncbi:MAG: DUF971 domain-containing protein [Proteobacteria bacterium]|nr:DUF971 domain-containing protein [Pseudomonadota bacterium]